MMNGAALIKLLVEYECSSGGSIVSAIRCRGYVDVNVVRRWQGRAAGRAFLSWLCAAAKKEKLGKS